MSFTPCSRSALCLSAAMTSLVLPLSAQAQTFDDVIVTALKRPSSAQDLGLSLSVIDGEGLERFDSAEELTQKLAGVQAAVANGNQIAFQIRGIGAVDHQALTPTAAAVYVDGVFQATNVQTGPLLYDLERVEVLKGPQGSLYGRNATAGAINFISKRPSDKREGYVSSEIGNFDRFNVNAAANLPISDDFALRLSGRYLTQGPQIDNVVTDPAVSAPSEAGGERDEFGLRALGLWTPSDATEVLLNVHYAEDNGINPSPRNEGLDLGEHEISVGPTGVQDTDNEFYGASVEVSHDFGGFELTSLTAYEGYNQQYGFDFGGRTLVFGSPNANLAYDRDFSQFSQELRLARTGERYSTIAGVYLESEDFDQEYLIWCGELDRSTLIGSCPYVGAPGRVGTEDRRVVRDVNGDPVLVDVIDDEGIVIGTEEVPINASTLQSLISQERQTAALFTYNQYEITPKLDFIWGARLTYENIEGEGEGRHIFEDGVVGLNNFGDLGAAIGSNEISETRLSGNLGVNYRPSNTTLIYANYSNGYKSGGFNGEVINNVTHFADEGLFDEETVDTLETGLKYTRQDFRLNVSGFYNFYDSPQARIFVPFDVGNGSTITSNSLSNLDEAVSFGIEADLVVTPTEGLTLSAGLTWLDTEIEQDSDPDVPQNAANFDGNPLPFASEYSGVIAANYHWPLSESLEANVNLSAKYQSEFFLDAEGLEDRKQRPYLLLDMEAGILINDTIELGVWGRNLGDLDYAVSGYGFDGFNTFRGAPRTYGVSLKYSY